MNVSLVGSSEDLIMIVTNSTSVVVDSLHPDYLYQCSVAARNSAGLGTAKTVLERTLPDGESVNGLYIVRISLQDLLIFVLYSSIWATYECYRSDIRFTLSALILEPPSSG